MSPQLAILMAQINPQVGAVAKNRDIIIQTIQSEQLQHDLILFPELALSGYPPEDLLFREDFLLQITEALEAIQVEVKDCYVIVGHPIKQKGLLFNAASVFYQGKRIALYHKQFLPNYGVFDEKRYFDPGLPQACIWTIKNYTLGLCICEDIWEKGPVEQLLAEGVNVLLCINASPFDYEKPALREELLKSYAKRGLTIIYVNLVGGQDELVFDGQSLALDNTGQIKARAPAFQSHLQTVTLQGHKLQGELASVLSQDALIYEALVCGTRDYVSKNHFSKVLLGLSGGIDSALTLSIAVDALGSENVHVLILPSRYTSALSLEQARKQADILKVSYDILSIEPTFQTLLDSLTPLHGLGPDSTEENLQARIRALFLMAYSNKKGHLLLTTSNKSETSVGYTTLYGDMSGGFAVLKDVLKTQVYALARYRNTLSEVIPEKVINRAPTAELAFNQYDQDSLPDYAILDGILTGFIEKNLSIKELITLGFHPQTVKQVLAKILRNEYKRQQAAPGVKISVRAFDRDWRYPISNGFIP